MIEKVGSAAMKLAYSYLDANPEKNMPKILNWVDLLDRDDIFKSQRNTFRKVIEDKNNNWYRLLLSLWDDVDSGVRKKVFENFLINATVLGCKRQDELKEVYDCNIPWAILMDPTSACNLHCIGCWAADYGNRLSMDLKTLDKIILQGKELGIYFYIYSGGEPLVR
ncbi:MAG TPA: radical SAM protein, partial [Ruminococcaceae bacterium]|nr:radical SAM protein [Oscillospiraceae bacterium]